MPLFPSAIQSDSTPVTKVVCYPLGTNSLSPTPIRYSELTQSASDLKTPLAKPQMAPSLFLMVRLKSPELPEF